MTHRKKTTVIAAAVMVAALLLTGTFAWKQMISKTNEFIGTKESPTLHDDFNPAFGMKDVYVENTAKRPIFVRVKLDEAMKLGSNEWRPDTDGYIPHTYDVTAENCEHDMFGKEFHDYFHWTMGGQKYYMPADGTSVIVDDRTVYTGAEDGVKQTPLAEIISIFDYLLKNDAERSKFTGWIYDTDGYAYWSQPLLEGAVTGLLLHGVATDKSLADTEYYYAIDVKVHAVDLEDLPMWTKGAPAVDGTGTTDEATPDAKTVLEWLVTRLP